MKGCTNKIHACRRGMLRSDILSAKASRKKTPSAILRGIFFSGNRSIISLLRKSTVLSCTNKRSGKKTRVKFLDVHVSPLPFTVGIMIHAVLTRMHSKVFFFFEAHAIARHELTRSNDHAYHFSGNMKLHLEKEKGKQEKYTTICSTKPHAGHTYLACWNSKYICSPFCLFSCYLRQRCLIKGILTPDMTRHM